MLRYFLVSLFFLPLGLNAQSITGTVSDLATSAPIEYASVRVLRMQDSLLVQGGLTDSSGRYHVVLPNPGMYSVHVGFLGYFTKVYDSISVGTGETVNLGSILLSPNTGILNAVVVEEEKNTVQYGIDKKVYNPEKDIVSKGGSALDLLQNIPSIQIDADRNIQYRGSSNITVYIDGKPSALTGGGTAVLDQIPAENIERIEIISNPSAKYDAEGSGGIINIITKKGVGKAYQASVNFTAGTNDKYQGNLLLNRNWKKWNLSLSYGLNQRHNWSKNTSHRSLWSPDTTHLDQVGGGLDKDLIHTARFTVDYALNAKNQLVFSSGINHQTENENDLTDYLFLDQALTTDSFGYRLARNREVEQNLDMALSWRHQFTKKGHQMNVDASVSNNTSDHGMFANQSFFLPDWSPSRPGAEQHTQARRNNFLYVLQTDYELPIGKTMLYGGGLKATLRSIDDDFFSESREANEFYTEDVSLSNRFLYTENVYAAYSTFAHNGKRWSYLAGVRTEYTATHSRQRTISQDVKRGYLDLFPSLFIGYKINSTQELRANVSRRISRPRSGQLNPFLSFSDPLNQQQGNPYLNPEYILSYEIYFLKMAKKYTFNAGIYWRDTRHQIIRYREVTSEGVSLTTFENLNTSRSAGVEVVWQYSFSKKLRLNANVNAYNVSMKADNLVQGLANSVWGAHARMALNATLRKGLEGQFSYNFFRPGWALQGKIDPFHSVDLGLKQDLFKGKGSVNLRVTDLFNTRQFAVETNGQNFTQENIWKRESRVLYIGFSYRIGNDGLKAAKKPSTTPSPEGGMDDF